MKGGELADSNCMLGIVRRSLDAEPIKRVAYAARTDSNCDLGMVWWNSVDEEGGVAQYPLVRFIV